MIVIILYAIIFMLWLTSTIHNGKKQGKYWIMFDALITTVFLLFLIKSSIEFWSK